MPRIGILGLFLVVLLANGCGQRGTPGGSITLATTTSVQDSGLLDALLPRFREQSGIEVKVVAVGSGQAMELGRRGDADVLITHAPAAEEAFMADGWGKERRPIMHNDFLLVGPQADPAGVRGTSSIVKALTQLAERKELFISRGDESGTHTKEREIWSKAKLNPEGAWYVQAGAGMSQVLRIAHEKKAYTLTDRGTWLALRNELELVVLFEGDPILKNHYSVMSVNPEKHQHVNETGARRFMEFLTSPEARKMIGEFGVSRYGAPLFVPESGG